MSSSTLYRVVVVLLCTVTFVTVNNAQQLTEENIQTLREYLLRRGEELEQPVPEAETFEDNELAQRSDDGDLQVEAGQLPALEDEQVDNVGDDVVETLPQQERSTEGKDLSRRPSDKSARKNWWLRRKEFFDRQVVKAEKTRFSDDGAFYTDYGVVVTLQDKTRLLIRNVRGIRCFGECRSVSIIPAKSMTKKWESLETKDVTKSTLGDFVKVSKAARGSEAAADDMMALS